MFKLPRMPFALSTSKAEQAILNTNNFLVTRLAILEKQDQISVKISSSGMWCD